MKHVAFPILLVLLVTLSTFVGCAEDQSPASATPPNPTGMQHDEPAMNHDEHNMAPGQSDMEKMKTALAKLSPEDAASAEKQHFCPVSGKMLGVMGAPQKVSVNGHTVWICCSGCEEKLLADPDTYLAKLRDHH